MNSTPDFEAAAETAADQATTEVGDDPALDAQDDLMKRVRDLLPSPADQDMLDELVAMLAQGSDRNEKIGMVVKNINRFAGLFVNLMEALK